MKRLQNLLSILLLLILLPIFFLLFGGMMLVESALCFCHGSKLEKI